MIRTLIYLGAVVAVGSGVGFGQDRLSKFQQKVEKSWDDIRPRGKILQQLRDSFRSERDERGRSDGQPTPAAPPRTADGSTPVPPGASGGGGWKLPWRDEPEQAAKDRLSSNSPWPRSARRDADDRNLQERDAAKSRTARGSKSSEARAGTASNRTPTNSRGSRADDSVARNAAPLTDAAPSTGISLGVVIDEKRAAEKGLRIAKVARNSPADRAGLRNGDILLTIAGVEMTDLQILDQLLAAFGPQDQVQIEYQRGKKSAETMLSFSEQPMATDESLAETPNPDAYDDASLAPLPPGLPPGIEAGTAPSTSPGLISVLDEPRRANRSARENSNRAEKQPASVYPSPQVLPPLTGSSVGTPPGSSILREGSPRGRTGIPDKSLFQRLPPRDETQSPAAPAPEASDDELLEIELLSPDGN